ncbi:MAG: hypothetical protein P8178_09540 [Candidatus Thiodiazotropha sp.]
MGVQIPKPEDLAAVCAKLGVEEGIDALTARVNALIPGLSFERVVTRGRWHRLGGVVDADYRPVSSNIVHWAEQVSGGDVDTLIASYGDAGYFATKLAGKTHYFTAICGDAPEAFVQLEIEELQEVLDRPLIEPDWFPDSIEEFLDPLDYPRLAPEPVARPYWQFRRITPVAKLLDEAQKENQALFNLRRFFSDWAASSAQESEPFCRHWALALREYLDSDGEYRLSAKPFRTYQGEISPLPAGESLHGVGLAHAIHAYDREVGYPFAWYFHMLASKAENYSLAQAVLRDLMGAYDYLPARDLKVLREWEKRPYGV